MNDLEKYFLENSGNLIYKWMHYFEIYDRHFSRFRGTEVHLLEIGVYHGGSLRMWKDYFGSRARIFGVDCNPQCKQFEDEQITIFIGDQADRQFLRTLAQAIPRLDILIDDGGHKAKQQIATFDVLFPHISMDGIYLCEDTHTSYWREYGGGYRKRASFVEYSKNFIDYIHAWHSREPRRLSVSEFTKSVHSLHFYDSVLVIEKRPGEQPRKKCTGCPSLPPGEARRSSVYDRLMRWSRGKRDRQASGSKTQGDRTDLLS